MAVQNFRDLLQTTTVDELVNKVIELGEQWSDKDAAASILEETKKTFLNRLIQDLASAYTGKTPAFAQLESQALADPRYQEHLRQMVDARREASKVRVRYDMGKARLDLLRSQMATLRQEQQMNNFPGRNHA